MQETENAAAAQGSENQSPLKLDYTIKDTKERVALVKKIVDNTPSDQLTHRYLQILADYIVFNLSDKQKKKRLINTDNRMITIRERQTSFEGLISKFENGEDGIYNFIINDKNVLLTPKYQITEKDLEDIPALKQLRDQIEKVELQASYATGRKKFLLKKQAIEMRKDQYVIRSAFKPVTYSLNLIKSINNFDLSDKVEIDPNGNPVNKGMISLFNPTHISILLCNYSKIKENCWDKLNSDIYYLMKDLEDNIDAALKDNYPMLYDILILKIDGQTNAKIQKFLEQKYGTTHTVEYLSSLWRKKIPKIIAEYEQKQFLTWYYTEVEKGKWKKCSCCGQIKLAHNKFFSKNSTSRDGFYSICKECRNKRNKEKKNKIKKKE